MKHGEGLDTATETRLIGRAMAGEMDAAEKLWAANRRWVAAIILAHRPKTVAVEDLLQEVAIKFISKLETLRDTAAFKPWLRQIALNACRGAARSSRPAVRLAHTEVPEPGEVAPPAVEEHRDADLDRLHAARDLYERVLSLPSEYREPLMMRCLQEMTYHQISEVLGLPVTTVETRLARARRMLREETNEALTDRNT